MYCMLGFGVGGNIPIDATITLEFLPKNRRFLLAALSSFQVSAAPTLHALLIDAEADRSSGHIGHLLWSHSEQLVRSRSQGV